MAFTSLRASAEFEGAAPATTLTFSPSSNIEVGDTVVLGWASNVLNTGVTTVLDNSTQAGAANVYRDRAPFGGSGSSMGTVYMLAATRQILTTDVITITLDTSCSRRAGQVMAFVPANGNARFELRTNIAGDTVSPVPQGATGTLYKAASLAVAFHCWQGGAVASGINTVVPTPSASWIACPGGGALTGGVSPRVEVNAYYNINVGATTTFTPSASYTSITVGNGETLIFTDEVPAGPPVVRSLGAAGGGAFGAGLTMNLPAFPQEDDLVLAFIAIEESATLGAAPVSGWTAVGSPISVTGGGALHAWWRKWVYLDTAPTISWTPTTDGAETQMMAIHCDTWDETTPFEIYHTSSEATVDTSWSYAPGTSTTVNNCLCWAQYTSGFDSASGQGSSTATNASLTGIVGRINASTAGGLGAGFTGATGILATAGSVGTWAATLLNASAKAYHSFAIRPWAAAAATGRAKITEVRRTWAGR